MAMERRLSPVYIEDLDWQDQRFAVHSYTRNAFLQNSLERHGLLCPPWLLQTSQGPPLIVDGFKRLKWLQDGGKNRVECLLFEAVGDPRDLMLQRLETKICEAPLNLAEKAQIVARLAELLPEQRVLQDYFPVLGLASRPRAVDHWSRVAAAEKLLLSGLAHDRLCERAALELIDCPVDERRGLIALLCELRCSASIQMEILERITEIALVQGKTRTALLASREMQDILQDPELNHRQKTQHLRDLLQHWRYPRLWARQERFQRSLEKCGLPPAMRVQPPPAFEGNGWQLQIQFSSPEELSQLLTSAQALASSRKLPELLGRPLADPAKKSTADTDMS
jgi:ParB family transcriptional regulator, chromosome partitioning protein